MSCEEVGWDEVFWVKKCERCLPVCGSVIGDVDALGVVGDGCDMDCPCDGRCDGVALSQTSGEGAPATLRSTVYRLHNILHD